MPQEGFSSQAWLDRLRVFLIRQRYSRQAIKNYRIVARRFLRFLHRRRLALVAVEPDHVGAYLRLERQRYERLHGQRSRDIREWRTHLTAPIHLLLRLAQGQWPPPSAVATRLAALRVHLEDHRYRPHAVTAYCIVARRFLVYLERNGRAVDEVVPGDISRFIAHELRKYEKRNGRPPKHFVEWRCSLTGSVHALLRFFRGQWPPPVRSHPWLVRLDEHLAALDLTPQTRAHNLRASDRFLKYLESHGIPPETVQPAHVATYVRSTLVRYHARHGRRPEWIDAYRSWCTTPIHRLLRLVHGHWPPDSRPEPAIERLETELRSERYSAATIIGYRSSAWAFVRFLRARGVPLEAVRPQHVQSYLEQWLAQARRMHGQPRNVRSWRNHQLRSAQRLLRMVQGEWPPAAEVTTSLERFRREVLDGYGRWLSDLHGLSQPTLAKNGYSARVFLDWLGERAQPVMLRRLRVGDVDAFLAWRNPRLRRATRAGVAHCLRSFLRYLHGADLIARDLAAAVGSPTLYWFESIPATLTDAHVKTLLAATRRERTPVGRRDYAILQLLATYGLRAGEVVSLRLEDIDWRRERLRVRHSKTGGEAFLPLTVPVGNALLDYLRHGRPSTEHREIFLRTRAPFRPFARSSILSSMINRRLSGLRMRPREGRHGAHAFRYARAVGLLRAQVSLKTIGDLLGHRSASSTAVYLKLATDDLRNVGLELPQEVVPWKSGRTPPSPCSSATSMSSTTAARSRGGLARRSCDASSAS